MKKLLLTLAVVTVTALTMYGQGRVSFNNTASGNGITVTTDTAFGIAPGEGARGDLLPATYSIQLLWAPQGTYATEASFLAAVVGSSTPIGFNAGPGFFVGGATPNPVGTSMPVAAYTMQARAWFNNGQFATYDVALAGGHNTGFSQFFNLTPTASPATAPITLGLLSFGVGVPVPEPSTFALAGLGAAALLLFRRRK
jgi:hypothetical protein